MTEVYLNISERRKRFKDSMGQANHFLITALIGLEYINNNEVSCPESFSTSWNPKNKKSSVERTRLYILKSSLSWAIDCLDTYLLIYLINLVLQFLNLLFLFSYFHHYILCIIYLNRTKKTWSLSKFKFVHSN